MSSKYRLKSRRDSESQPLLSSDISRAPSECNFMMFYQSETSDSEASSMESKEKSHLMNHLRSAFSRDLELRPPFTPKRNLRMETRPSQRKSAGNMEMNGEVPVVKLTRQNSLVTIFAVWNTMMGTGLLAMPWGIERSGLLLGPALMLILGALCLYTAYLNLKAEREFGTPTGEISELTRTLLGPTAEYFAKVFSFIVLLGANIVYWILMCNFLYYTVNWMFGLNEEIILNDLPVNISAAAALICPTHMIPVANKTAVEIEVSKIWDLHNTVPIFLAIIIAPLLNFKSPTFFTKFNTLGTMSVMYLIIFVLVKSFLWGVNIDISDRSSLNYTPLFSPSFPATSGMLALSYFIHNIIITIMRSNNNQKKNGRDLTIAYFLVVATYMTIGVVYYVAFPLQKSCIPDNLLNNFPSGDYMTLGARGFLLFQLVTVFPLITYMLRAQTMVAITGKAFPSWLHVIVFNTIIVIVCILFAVFLPRIGTIIRYTGALSGLVHVFTIPCLLRLAVLKKRGRLSMWSWIVFLIIPIYGAVNLLGQFFVSDSSH